jgi:hypothetical protein
MFNAIRLTFFYLISHKSFLAESPKNPISVIMHFNQLSEPSSMLPENNNSTGKAPAAQSPDMEFNGTLPELQFPLWKLGFTVVIAEFIGHERQKKLPVLHLSALLVCRLMLKIMEEHARLITTRSTGELVQDFERTGGKLPIGILRAVDAIVLDALASGRNLPKNCGYRLRLPRQAESPEPRHRAIDCVTHISSFNLQTVDYATNRHYQLTVVLPPRAIEFIVMGLSSLISRIVTCAHYGGAVADAGSEAQAHEAIVTALAVSLLSSPHFLRGEKAAFRSLPRVQRLLVQYDENIAWAHEQEGLVRSSSLWRRAG